MGHIPMLWKESCLKVTIFWYIMWEFTGKLLFPATKLLLILFYKNAELSNFNSIFYQQLMDNGLLASLLQTASLFFWRVKPKIIFSGTSWDSIHTQAGETTRVCLDTRSHLIVDDWSQTSWMLQILSRHLDVNQRCFLPFMETHLPLINKHRI